MKRRRGLIIVIVVLGLILLGAWGLTGQLATYDYQQGKGTYIRIYKPRSGSAIEVLTSDDLPVKVTVDILVWARAETGTSYVSFTRVKIHSETANWENNPPVYGGQWHGQGRFQLNELIPRTGWYTIDLRVEYHSNGIKYDNYRTLFRVATLSERRIPGFEWNILLLLIPVVLVWSRRKKDE